MDLYRRDKLETQMRRAVAKALKKSNSGKRTAPGWTTLERNIVDAVEPIMRKIQLAAIRAMYGRYSNGPSPSHVLPQAGQRAKDLARDLIEVSRNRWIAIGPKRSDEDVAAWWKQNFGSERAKLIGITETTIAHQKGEDIAWAAMKKDKSFKDGKGLVGIWITEQGPCSACLQMSGKHDKYWRRFYPAGPPSPHPGCRCHVEHMQLY